MEVFVVFLRLKIYFFASGSKFCKFGPAITPTKPNKTKDPIPKPAAHGLKPPNALNQKILYELKVGTDELTTKLSCFCDQ